MKTIQCPECGKDDLFFRSDAVASYVVKKDKNGNVNISTVEYCVDPYDSDKWLECFTCGKNNYHDAGSNFSEKIDDIFNKI